MPTVRLASLAAGSMRVDIFEGVVDATGDTERHRIQENRGDLLY